VTAEVVTSNARVILSPAVTERLSVVTSLHVTSDVTAADVSKAVSNAISSAQYDTATAQSATRFLLRVNNDHRSESITCLHVVESYQPKTKWKRLVEKKLKETVNREKRRQKTKLQEITDDARLKKYMKCLTWENARTVFEVRQTC